jgi:hypothetical protein
VTERLAASQEELSSMELVNLEGASSCPAYRLLVCYVVTFY